MSMSCPRYQSVAASVFAVVSIPAIKRSVAIPRRSSSESGEPSSSASRRNDRRSSRGLSRPSRQQRRQVAMDLLVHVNRRLGVVAALFDDRDDPSPEHLMVCGVDAQNFGQGRQLGSRKAYDPTISAVGSRGHRHCVTMRRRPGGEGLQLGHAPRREEREEKAAGTRCGSGDPDQVGEP